MVGQDPKPRKSERIFAYLNEIRLIFLVPRRDYPMHFPTKTELYSKLVCECLISLWGPKGANLLLIVVWDIPF